MEPGEEGPRVSCFLGRVEEALGDVFWVEMHRVEEAEVEVATFQDAVSAEAVEGAEVVAAAEAVARAVVEVLVVLVPNLRVQG